MLKISVFTKDKGNLVRIFRAEDINKAVDEMRSIYGEKHSDNYEVEIERIKC